MDVLGVEAPPSLAAFFDEVTAVFAADGRELVIEAASGPEFGGFYLEEGKARVTLRDDLPPDARLHTLGHELVHGLQRREGWPLATGNPALGEGSAAGEIASVLQALVHCANAEMRIAPLGLDPSWEQGERQENIRMMLRAPHQGANTEGSPAWAYWSLLYAYLDLLHAPERTRTLLRNFHRTVPNAARTGETIAAAVREHGYATREQALAAMTAVWDMLRLGTNVLIEDPRAGTATG